MEEMNTKRIKIKRLLRFWGVNSQSEILVVCLFELAAVGYFAISASGDTLESTLRMSVLAIPFVAAMMNFGYGIPEMRNFISITLTMGGTRKEANIGLHFSMLLKLIESSLIYIAFCIVTEAVTDLEVFNSYLIAGAVVLYIGASGLGRVTGAVAVKYGPIVAGIILGGVCGFMGFWLGSGFFTDSKFGTDDFLYNINWSEDNTKFMIIIAAIAIAIYVVSGFINYLLLKKYEVKNA